MTKFVMPLPRSPASVERSVSMLVMVSPFTFVASMWLCPLVLRLIWVNVILRVALRKIPSWVDELIVPPLSSAPVPVMLREPDGPVLTIRIPLMAPLVEMRSNVRPLTPKFTFST